eukprot:COSAG01_NODE_535_length_15804_cov_33.841452_4_plen_555_part_00
MRRCAARSASTSCVACWRAAPSRRSCSHLRTFTGAREHTHNKRTPVTASMHGIRAGDDRMRGGGIRRRRPVPSPPPRPPHHHHSPPMFARASSNAGESSASYGRAVHAMPEARRPNTREESASRSPRVQRGAARAPAVPPSADAARLLGQLARADSGGRGGGGGGRRLDDLNGQGGAFFVRRLRRRALHPPATAGSLDTHGGPMTRSDLGVPAFDDLEARAERLQRCVGDRRCRRGPAAARKLRLLLTRRARNASGTATQCTRRNDAPAHPGAPATACAGRSHPRRRRRRRQCPPPPPPPARPPDARSTPPDTAPRCRRPRRSRRLLTRRARNASGTATQSTRGKDSPSLVRWSQPRARAQPRTPRQSPCSTTLALSCSGGAAAALADPSVGGGSAWSASSRSHGNESTSQPSEPLTTTPWNSRLECSWYGASTAAWTAVPIPIDAPCTQCLRHGDPIHASKGLTLGEPLHPQRRRARAAGTEHPLRVHEVARAPVEHTPSQREGHVAGVPRGARGQLRGLRNGQQSGACLSDVEGYRSAGGSRDRRAHRHLRA